MFLSIVAAENRIVRIVRWQAVPGVVKKWLNNAVVSQNRQISGMWSDQGGSQYEGQKSQCKTIDKQSQDNQSKKIIIG